LNLAVVRGKGRLKGARNKTKERGYRITSTWRNLSQFELPSSLALAVLGRGYTNQESTAVSNFIAQANID
jgi:hypothetical protein